MRTILVFVTMTYITMTSTLIQEIQLPPEMQSCFDRVLAKSGLTEIIGEKVVWRCVQGVLWEKIKEFPGNKLEDVTLKWAGDLITKSLNEAHAKRRQRRQASRTGQRGRGMQHLRIRKEYRMLTDQERNNFHRALNMLKRDTSVPPNRFDALGLLHENLGDRSHDGPNFLGWHRLFLVVAENALREKVPGVTIPYWDSTLDGGLLDPRSSIMWTPEFMGNANGRIRTGPFTGWRTPTTGLLLRNYGTGGTMMNWTSLRDTFSRKHLSEINHPYADPKYNIEDHHGEPHLWVGGHMAPQALAGYDPVFLMHHSFVDLLWELFRRIQRRRNPPVDPTTDYPAFVNLTGHGYNDSSGFGNLLNRHALSDIYTTEIYTYQLPPTCTKQRPDCGSRYIRCDTSKVKARCISRSIFDPDPRDFWTERGLPMHGSTGMSDRVKRATVEHQSNSSPFDKQFQNFEKALNLQCLDDDVNQKYVNNFEINGVVDPNSWAYIPVQIIYHYDTRTLENETQAVYPKCKTGHHISSRVYIESNGLTYRGFYKEITTLKKILPIVATTTYIGVRNPEADGASDVILSAYDSCGRICRPYCKSESRYFPCKGAIRITEQNPKMYGNTVETLISDMWSPQPDGALPELHEERTFLKFYCDKKSVWPWS